MTLSTSQATTDKKKRELYWAGLRKTGILVLILIWLIFFFKKYESIDEKAFYVLFGLISLFLIDHLYSIILSAKASEFLKSFMFQSFIPMFSLSLVAILSFQDKIDSSTTLSLFGLSIGYTTYVVGKRLKRESTNSSNGEDINSKE